MGRGHGWELHNGPAGKDGVQGLLRAGRSRAWEEPTGALGQGWRRGGAAPGLVHTGSSHASPGGLEATVSFLPQGLCTFPSVLSAWSTPPSVTWLTPVHVGGLTFRHLPREAFFDDHCCTHSPLLPGADCTGVLSQPCAQGRAMLCICPAEPGPLGGRDEVCLVPTGPLAQSSGRSVPVC